MVNGLILAGGKATRLGPLSSQLSKALVSVRTRPQFVNQVLWMRANGIDGEITIVVSESTYDQVAAVVRHTGLVNIRIARQYAPGVAAAVVAGLRYDGPPTLVIMSDTMVDDKLHPNELKEDWVGVARAESGRAWTYFDLEERCFVKGDIPVSSCAVTIGVYMITQPNEFIRTAVNEEDIAKSLSNYMGDNPVFRSFKTWRDVGDMRTLGVEHGSQFIARDMHELRREGQLVVKHTSNTHELQFMREVKKMPPSFASLFPQVYWVDEHDGAIAMDYIDMPTLAELYLYWPILEGQWEWIVDTVVHNLMEFRAFRHVEPGWTTEFFSRIGIRYTWQASTWGNDKWGDDLEGGGIVQDLVRLIGVDHMAKGHGDPNFTNILFSSSGACMKFIDPRGGVIPTTYELAKICYSPMFARITHDLYDQVSEATLEADRRMMDTFVSWMDAEPKRVKAAMALAFLSGAPLHNEVQATQLFNEGMRLVREVLS